MKTQENIKLGQELYETRKAFGWSQDDAARYFSVGQATIWRIENGDMSALSRRVVSDFLRMVKMGMVRATDLPAKPTDEIPKPGTEE